MEKVEYYFREISKIPRGSYNEKAICDYVENFAKERNIKYVRDKMHNIVLFKEATKGYEDHETVMLEGHMDMVCEKNNDSDHDFSKDSIELIEEDGFLHANKTTLGADDGVGVCYMLALLDDESLKHPALECVFTVQEEVGLNGAMGLDKSILKAKKMIGLDRGKEKIITVSCSGGRRAVVEKGLSYLKNESPCYQLYVGGLQGGHSGGVIHLERGNANVIMTRVYYHLSLNNIEFLLGSFILGVFVQTIVVIIPMLANIFKLVPLNFIQWGITLLISIIPIPVIELQKKINASRLENVIDNGTGILSKSRG